MTKEEAQVSQFARTLDNLKDVLEKMPQAGENHAVFRDSAIQRFEIAFDICWKTLKEYLLSRFGVQTASPKKVFQEAFKQGIINNDNSWLDLTDMRNETTHAYDEAFAERVLVNLPAAEQKMRELLWTLQK